MKLNEFKQKGYYRPLVYSYWSSLVALSILLILAGIFESDVEIAGFVWSTVLATIYWLIKKLFYFVMFRNN